MYVTKKHSTVKSWWWLLASEISEGSANYINPPGHAPPQDLSTSQPGARGTGLLFPHHYAVHVYFLEKQENILNYKQTMRTI